MLARFHPTLMKAFYPAYFALAATAFAQTWTGAVSGNWNVPGNWDTGIPTSGTTTAIVFDQAIQPTTNNDIPGGLTLNSLVFGSGSGVRTTSGNPLTFDGTNPVLRMLNATGSGNSILGNSIVLNQTLSIEGGPGFSTQFIQDPGSVISGVGGIRVTGGVVAFNGINTYSGATVVEAGGLGANRATSFGNSPSVTVQAGGWLQLISSSSFTINKPLTLAGSGAPSLNASFTLSASAGGAKGWSGPITLADDAIISSFNGTSLTLSGSSDLSLSGHDLTFTTGSAAADAIPVSKVISGNGDVTIKAGAASEGVIFSAANAFTGNILVSSGRLSVTSNASLGTLSNSITLDGGVLGTVSGTTIPASRPISIGTGGGGFRGGAGSQASQALVIESALAGANPINIQQRVVLRGSNSFSGTVTVLPGGVLETTADAGLGDIASEIRLNGGAAGTARVLLPPDFNPARIISIPGTKGAIETTAPVTFIHPFTGPGELAINSWEGAVTLTTANTHEGGTVIESGRVTIHSDSALGPVDKPFTLGNQAVLAASQDLTIPATRPMRLSGGDIDTTGVTIQVLGNMEGINGGSASITGTGIFRFDGMLTGGAFIEDATFAGTGTLDDFVTISGDAILSPGTDVAKGAITMNNLRMNEGTFRVKVGGGASDKLVVTEGLVFQMNAKLEVLVRGAVVAGDTFTVVEKNGTAPHNTSFYSPTEEYLGNGQTFTGDGVIWTINYQGGDGNEVTVTALNGNAFPLAPPSFADLVLTPPSSSDPESLDGYPKVSGKVVSGVPGSTVFLESSTDLGQADDWTLMETFTLDTAGEGVFTDLFSFDAPAAPRNFYRLRVP